MQKEVQKSIPLLREGLWFGKRHRETINMQSWAGVANFEMPHPGKCKVCRQVIDLCSGVKNSNIRLRTSSFKANRLVCRDLSMLTIVYGAAADA